MIVEKSTHFEDLDFARSYKFTSSGQIVTSKMLLKHLNSLRIYLIKQRSCNGYIREITELQNLVKLLTNLLGKITSSSKNSRKVLQRCNQLEITRVKLITFIKLKRF